MDVHGLCVNQKAAWQTSQVPLLKHQLYKPRLLCFDRLIYAFNLRADRLKGQIWAADWSSHLTKENSNPSSAQQSSCWVTLARSMYCTAESLCIGFCVCVVITSAAAPYRRACPMIRLQAVTHRPRGIHCPVRRPQFNHDIFFCLKKHIQRSHTTSFTHSLPVCIRACMCVCVSFFSLTLRVIGVSSQLVLLGSCTEVVESDFHGSKENVHYSEECEFNWDSLSAGKKKQPNSQNFNSAFDIRTWRWKILMFNTCLKKRVLLRLTALLKPRHLCSTNGKRHGKEHEPEGLENR